MGFIFTEFPIAQLRERGFNLLKDESNLARGYRSFHLDFAEVSVQFHQVLDEDLYLKEIKHKDFHPYAVESSPPPGFVPQTNGVSRFVGSLDLKDIEPGSLHDYLLIRKEFKELVALELGCENLPTFNSQSHPDQEFVFQGHKVSLLHFGPNCFDLLVS